MPEASLIPADCLYCHQTTLSTLQRRLKRFPPLKTLFYKSNKETKKLRLTHRLTKRCIEMFFNRGSFEQHQFKSFPSVV